MRDLRVPIVNSREASVIEVGFLAGDDIGVLRGNGLPSIWRAVKHENQDGLSVSCDGAVRCFLTAQREPAMHDSRI